MVAVRPDAGDAPVAAERPDAGEGAGRYERLLAGSGGGQGEPVPGPVADFGIANGITVERPIGSTSCVPSPSTTCSVHSLLSW